MPVPHEHGAWGLVLEPFAAAAILGKHGSWLLLPAFVVTLGGFLLREPLILLTRQRWAGHRKTAASSAAILWLAVEGAAVAVSLAMLASRLPWLPLSILIAAGLLLTAISVWFSVKNWQRSVGLQLVAVPGLGGSALVAALASARTIPEWAWLLWAVLSLHGIVAVFCVHARLEMRIRAARPGGDGGDPRRVARIAVTVQFAAAVAAAIYLGPLLAVPMLFSAAIHIRELLRLSDAGHLSERLQRVGLRMLGLSIAHMALAIAALWTFNPA